MVTVVLKRPKKAGESDWVLVPEGKYRIKIMNVEDTADGYGSLRVDMKFLLGEYAGKSASLRAFPGEALQSLFEVAGYETEGVNEIKVNDFSELIGLDANVFLTVKEKNGKTYNVLKRFQPAPAAKKPTEEKAA